MMRTTARHGTKPGWYAMPASLVMPRNWLDSLRYTTSSTSHASQVGVQTSL